MEIKAAFGNRAQTMFIQQLTLNAIQIRIKRLFDKHTTELFYKNRAKNTHFHHPALLYAYIAQ